MPIALSFSRLSTYQQCKKKFKEQFLTKTYPDDSGNVHFIKGKKKHGQFDNYIKCINDPTQIKQIYDGDVLNGIKIVDSLRSASFTLQSEVQLAVKKGFVPCTWYDKQTTFRAIADLLAFKNEEAVFGDWKTGSYRDYDSTPTGQLHLSAAVGFASYPQVNVIKTAYFFIESKQSVIRQFTRDMYDNGLTIPFLNAYDEVNQETEFAPKRNPYCNFCLIKFRCEAFGNDPEAKQ